MLRKEHGGTDECGRARMTLGFVRGVVWPCCNRKPRVIMGAHGNWSLHGDVRRKRLNGVCEAERDELVVRLVFRQEMRLSAKVPANTAATRRE